MDVGWLPPGQTGEEVADPVLVAVAVARHSGQRKTRRRGLRRRFLAIYLFQKLLGNDSALGLEGLRGVDAKLDDGSPNDHRSEAAVSSIS